MRLLICAGGTGGGVYPALVVLQAVRDELEQGGPESSQPTEGRASSALSVLWVGSMGGMEADLVKRAGVPFEAIPAAGVHGVGLRALPGNLLQLARGYRRAGAILRRFRPDALFFTGGYVAVPMALAGRRVPSLLYVPDIEPGLALKVLARFADRIAVTAEESRPYLPASSDLRVSGYPTRPELRTWNKAAALEAFGLSAELPVLLVFGGSTGARSINRALLAALPELLGEMQILHVSGKLDWDEVVEARSRLAEKLGPRASEAARYQPFPYLHEEMGAAFSAADLVVSRSGASTLGELPLFSLPAVLVPYPYAWRYQKVNADFLAKHGAAVILPDQDLPERLAGVVRDLIADRARLARMRQSMGALASPGAAGSISSLLVQLARQKGQRGK